jgi:hypothetical protein
MINLFTILIGVFILHASAYPADKIRITVSGLGGQFMIFPDHVKETLCDS